MPEPTTFGPYQNEHDTYDSSLDRDVSLLRGHGAELGAAVRNVALEHLHDVCETAGVEVGAYDERVLAWLSGYEVGTVQVFIGLISRAYTAGRQGPTDETTRRPLGHAGNCDCDQCTEWRNISDRRRSGDPRAAALRALLGHNDLAAQTALDQVAAEDLAELAGAANKLSRMAAKIYTSKRLAEQGEDPPNATVLPEYLRKRGGEQATETAPVCGRCGRPFDQADTHFDGHGQYLNSGFCRACINRCHESTDFMHACVICDPEAIR